jgi:hypothetical protein
VKARRAVRYRGSHSFGDIGLHMAVWLSALCARRPIPTGRSLMLISTRGYVDSKAIGRLER